MKWMRIRIRGARFNTKLVEHIYKEISEVFDRKPGEPSELDVWYSTPRTHVSADCIDICIEYDTDMSECELGYRIIDVFHATVRGYGGWCQVNTVKALPCALTSMASIGDS